MRGKTSEALVRMDRSSMPVPRSSGASIGRDSDVDSRPICVATSATRAGSRMLKLAIETVRRSFCTCGRSHSHMILPHRSCAEARERHSRSACTGKRLGDMHTLAGQHATTSCMWPRPSRQ